MTVNTIPQMRYLTPRECFRLMGQLDRDIDKIETITTSNSTQYRLAGNSIVVDVLVAIFKGIYIEETFTDPRPKQKSIDSY